MLDKIAGEMRSYALAHPRVKGEAIRAYQRQLSGGLMLTLFIDLQQVWHLSLARMGKEPSAAEIKTIKRYFEVPEEANREARKMGQWEIIRFTWKDAAQIPLFQMAPVDNNDNYYKD